MSIADEFVQHTVNNFELSGVEVVRTVYEHPNLNNFTPKRTD
jgi:hypothetical protein